MSDSTTQPTAPRSAFKKVVRRGGVAVIAAALVAPLALPAMASQNGVPETDSLVALSAQDAQDVTAVVTAGSPELDEARLQIAATTPEELQVIRDRIAAEQAAAEQAAAEQAAEEQAQAEADSAATSNSSSSSSSQTAAAPAGASVSAGAGMGSVIANAALDQVGEAQDCVRLVRDSLEAAGIGGYTGMGSLFNLGPTISQSQATPGDVIYYADGGTGRAHVAIYIGGGQAVHGGWSGYNTVVAGVNIGGSAPVFIDVA